MAIGQNFSGLSMATMRQIRSATETNPSVKLSEKFDQSSCLPDDIQYRGHQSSTRQTNIDCVQHNFPAALMPEHGTPQLIFYLGELGDRGLRDPEARPSKCLRD